MELTELAATQFHENSAVCSLKSRNLSVKFCSTTSSRALAIDGSRCVFTLLTEAKKRSRSKASSPIFFYSRWAEFKKEKHTELTGLEPAASCVTGRHSNQLSYSS